MLRIGWDLNTTSKECPSKKLPFFHLHSTCKADIWWRVSTGPKKKSFGGKSPTHPKKKSFGGKSPTHPKKKSFGGKSPTHPKTKSFGGKSPTHPKTKLFGRKSPTHPKTKSFGRKSPILMYLGRYRGRKLKVWKLMNNCLIVSEESFEFKKIKLNEHGHIHQASESAKNLFLYPNFKSKSYITNLLLVLWPFNWHKKIKYFKIHDISWFFK